MVCISKKSVTFVLLILLTFSLGLFTNVILSSKHQSFTPKADELKIVGGTDATEGEFPFIVALFDKSKAVFHYEMNVYDPNKSLYYHDIQDAFFCTGTVTKGGNVLTAAHCVIDKSVKDIGVAIGILDLKSVIRGEAKFNSTFPQVLEKSENKEYEQFAGIGDMAVLKLNLIPVEYVPLNKDSEGLDAIVASEQRMIVGWGRQLDGTTPRILQKADVTYQTQCLSYNKLNYLFTIHSVNTCYNNIHSYDQNGVELQTPTQAEKERFTTPGDSGGPFLVWRNGNWMQIGLLTLNEYSSEFDPKTGLGLGYVRKSYYVDIGHYSEWFK